MGTSTQQELAIAYRPGPKWLVQLLYVTGGACLLLAILRTVFLFYLLDPLAVFEVLLLVALSTVSLMAAFRIQQRNITLSKEGIQFPAFLCLPLLFRLTRKWNDVGAVALEVDETVRHTLDNDEEQRWMVFHFGSGGKVRIRLNDLTVNGLDTFFKASKRWGSTAVMAPELIELRRKLLSGPVLTEKEMSLTHLWEEELNSRFTATNFVPLPAGATLQNKRIRVIAQIAAGGLSAIYLAQLGDNKKIILKEMVVPSNSSASVEKAKAMFSREGSILIKLRHPQIARVHDHFVEDGRDYLVLDYIPGQSLRQLVLLDGAQSEDRVLEWAQVITGIVDFLHAQEPPVIHRDLTPDNIVLGGDGKLYIIDFGAANEFVGTATGTLIGKQAYIAPEQFRGKAVPASDIYSLGATLSFLLTGEEPEALSVSRPRTLRSSVSVETDEFVSLLTQLDTSKRLSTCAEVLRKIAELRSADRTSILKFGGGS